jgi:UDP-N-acetylmuramate dehydrogenase
MTADPATARLADLTTLRLGGPVARLVEASSTEELIDAVSSADAAGEPVLVLGAGSNLVVGDAGFDGVVVRVASRGISSEGDACGGDFATLQAGEPWDAAVEAAMEHGWVGLEALAGIPGTVGASPIQNVGAYGQDVSQTIARVRVWDRKLRGIRTFAAADCVFGYRSSRFKTDPGRHVILDVMFQLKTGILSAPITYDELARTLGVEPGTRAPLAEVRDAVLSLRRGKGMVLDAADHDTWSAGSFFTNPILEPERVPTGAPTYPGDGVGTVKTSAAWLIEHAGFPKGYGAESGTAWDGRVSVSTKHSLALTNRGGASTGDLLALAREIRDGVETTFDITLEAEPTLINCHL